MRRALAAALLAAALAGCATWPFGRGATLLDEADRLARDGELAAAVAKYDEYLARYPDAWAAPGALERRDALAATLTARQEVRRLREELARREDDLIRVRQEAERLRRDLERLKQIDLRLERR